MKKNNNNMEVGGKIRKKNTSQKRYFMYLALTRGNAMANASELEYENFFIFSPNYRSTSKEYHIVGVRWKPFLRIIT